VFKWRALDLVVRLMEHDSAIAWMRHLGRDPIHGRSVVIGTGILGDPVAVPWLIQKMSDPALARVAGESVSMITGWIFPSRGWTGIRPRDLQQARPTIPPTTMSRSIWTRIFPGRARSRLGPVGEGARSLC